MEQNREPRNKPHTYGLFIHDTGVKNIQQRKTVSSGTGADESGQLHVNQ